jgi:hypothetical protein
MTMSEFDLSGVDCATDRADDLRKINKAIERLAARRKTNIERAGPFAQSKLAWKVATYQQAMLYRVVALARGARDAWNARNVMVSLLATRALVETIAVFDDFEHTLSAHLANEDLQEMDKLLTNRIFATKDEELLDGHPEILAINVLTFIDRFEKRHGIPVRSHYDRASERCHPNSAGHHQLYSKTDYSNGTVTFSETKNLSAILDSIRAPLGLVFLFEQSMNALDPAILKTAETQHRLNPVV